MPDCGLLQVSEAPTASCGRSSRRLVASIRAVRSSRFSGVPRLPRNGLICANAGCDRQAATTNSVTKRRGVYVLQNCQGRTAILVAASPRPPAPTGRPRPSAGNRTRPELRRSSPRASCRASAGCRGSSRRLAPTDAGRSEHRVGDQHDLTHRPAAGARDAGGSSTFPARPPQPCPHHQRDRSGDLPNALPRSTELGAILDPVWPTHQGILPDAGHWARPSTTSPRGDARAARRSPTARCTRSRSGCCGSSSSGTGAG